SRRAEALRSLEQLKRGDIICVPGGRRAGIALVLDQGATGDDLPLPLVLTEKNQVKRLAITDFPVPVTPIDRIRIPNSFSIRSAKHRKDLAATVRNKLADRDLGKPARAGPDGLAARTTTSPGCAAGCAAIPAMAALIASSTPGRRRNSCGWSARPMRLTAGSPGAPM